MRKFWFAIIDIVLLMAISYAEKDEAGASIEEPHDVLLGDMVLSQEQMNFLYSTDGTKRFGLSSPFSQWPNATVFYDVDKSVDEKGKEVVIAAMNYIQNVSCVRFQLRDEATQHYVLIKSGKACSSKVGMRREGAQRMIVDGDLCSTGSIIHELLHTLGFLHMHTANDRDEYIDINWNNIRDDARINFKQFVAHVSMFKTEYDYDSITHYSGVAFAKDKSMPTIVPKKPAPNMGQRKAMSAGDITRLNRMYNCPNYEASITANGTSTKSTTQFPNGVGNGESKAVETLNAPRDNGDDLEKDEMKLNPNDTLTNDDEDDDMVLSKAQLDALYSLNAAKRNGLKSAFHYWPLGVVAFEIDPTFHPEFISTIYESMSYISNRSCIRFTPRTSYHKNYIYITKGPGCSSEVGMRHTGKQLMNINEELCSRGKIIHELLHSMGFLHMHTANERDDFIRVNWDNIKQKAWFNFKQFKAHVSMFSTPYDYDSIMHYSPAAFAINRSIPTIIPLQKAANMGQREAMSDGDVIRLNRMYKCGPPYNMGTLQPETKLATSKPSSSLFGMFIFKYSRGEN